MTCPCVQPATNHLSCRSSGSQPLVRGPLLGHGTFATQGPRWTDIIFQLHLIFYSISIFISLPPPKHFSSFCSIQIFTRLLILTWNMLSVEHDNHSIAFVFQLVVSVRWCIMHRIKIYFITQIYWIITNYYMSA